MRVSTVPASAGLALSLGVSAVLVLGGTGIAQADTRQSPSAGSEAGSGAASQTHRARVPRQAANRGDVRRPAAANSSSPRPVSSRARATSAGLAAIVDNRSPRVSPTVSVQAPDGTVSGSLNATDTDNTALRITLATPPALGDVTLDDGGNFTYTPDPEFAVTGVTDSFTVSVSDEADGFHLHGLAGLINLLTFGLIGAGGHTTRSTVTIGVAPFGTPANAAPTATVATGTPDPATGTVTGQVTGSDADGDPLTYSGSGPTAKGSVIVSETGSFAYTPTVAARLAAASPTAADADRQDSFTVTVDDSRGGTIAVVVSVVVSPQSLPDPVSPVEPPVATMTVGMNLESIVDWSPAWTFTDAFKASRPWISHAFNPQTFSVSWDAAHAPTLDLDSDGNVRSLKTWTDNGVAMRQYAGTLMFRGLGGGYAGGVYHAEWDGTGTLSFGMDATVIATGTTASGRNFAELSVTPTDDGIYLRIEETDPADPVRDINVWMPDYNGQSFAGQRWQPGAAFSPFHPLFLARLDPFAVLRFMAMQETNTSDIVSWSQRRDADDIRQGSGSEGTPSEPVVNGMSVEYMVELANQLDADPWFNMPHQADDDFVRNFAGYVLGHLEPGRTVYVEWSNEIWNFGYGFEASAWVADQARAAGLDPDYGQWIVAGREAKRDLDIWSSVLAARPDIELVRVASGWAAVPWVTNEILQNMAGSFDAIAIAPYITPTDEQRATYSAATSVDRILADTRANIAASAQWVSDHDLLATQWSARLGRPIALVAYEGGAHLDGRNAGYQGGFYAASNDARMGGIYRDYLAALDAAGLDLYVDFQFTGQPGPTPWGDFAKLHRMDEPLASAYRYNAVVAAAAKAQ